MMKILQVALVQLKVGKVKETNLARALDFINTAKIQKPDVSLVALPECFNSLYGTQHFASNAEKVPDGPSCKMLSQAAKNNNVFVVGGTIPEICEGKIYNTCAVFDPNGQLVAKYRKVHLFDINIPNKITFKESDTLSPGNELVTFHINNIKIGLGICYDMRFEEMAKLYRKDCCDVLIYPGSFNMVTGPLHWELLQRSRATDNQCYVITVSPARNEDGYISYGHSGVTDPWGKFVSLKEKEDILFHTLNLDEIQAARENIPVFNQRRLDLYDVIKKS